MTCAAMEQPYESPGQIYNVDESRMPINPVYPKLSLKKVTKIQGPGDKT